MHQIARTVFIAAALAILVEGTAYAQLDKRWGVGVSVTKFVPAESDLDSSIGVTPTFHRIPKPGWRLSLGLNWYNVDVGDLASDDDGLGKLTVRPLMGGVSYTFMNGDLAIMPSLVAGPAWNKLEVDDAVADLFSVSKADEDEFGKGCHDVDVRRAARRQRHLRHHASLRHQRIRGLRVQPSEVRRDIRVQPCPDAA